MRKGNKTRKLHDAEIRDICISYQTEDVHVIAAKYGVDIRTVYYHCQKNLIRKDKQKLSDTRSEAGKKGAYGKWHKKNML